MKHTKKYAFLIPCIVLLLVSLVGSALAVGPVSLVDETIDEAWQTKGDLIYAGYESGFVIKDVSADGGDASLDVINVEKKYISSDLLSAADPDAQKLPDITLPGMFAASDIRPLSNNCDDYFVTDGEDGSFSVFLYDAVLDVYRYVGVIKNEGITQTEDGKAVLTYSFFGRSYAVAGAKEVGEATMVPYKNPDNGLPAFASQDIIETDGTDGFYAYPGDYISVGSVYLDVENHVAGAVDLKASLLRQDGDEWVEVDSRSVSAVKYKNPFEQLICDFIIPADETNATDEPGHYRIVLSSDRYPFYFVGNDLALHTEDDWLNYGIYSKSTTLWPITGIYMGLNVDALKIIASGLEFSTTDVNASARDITITYLPAPYMTENEQDTITQEIELSLK